MKDTFLVKYRISVNRDQIEKRLTFRLLGPVPSAQFVDRLMDVYRRIEKPWLYKRLLDLRNFTGFLEYGDIEHLARKWAYLTRDETYRGKVATVSHDPLDLSRVSTLAPLFPQDVMRGFSALDPAIDWLSEPERHL